MRTVLGVDDDVLAAAKELARRKRTTTGKFVSEVMREASRARPHPAPADRMGVLASLLNSSGVMPKASKTSPP